MAISTMWFWDCGNTWNPFDDFISHELTSHKNRGLTSTIISVANNDYLIDFEQMTQTNQLTQRVRRIYQGFPDSPPEGVVSGISSSDDLSSLLSLFDEKLIIGSQNQNNIMPPPPPTNEELDDAAPDHLRCPITYSVFHDPVVIVSGNTYERAAISHWFENHNSDPKTNEPVSDKTMLPNNLIRQLALNFRDDFIPKTGAQTKKATAADSGE